MVSKDQTIGWLICLVCVVIAVSYTVTLVWPAWIWWASAEVVQMWLVGVPVYIALVAVLVIGAWIGWTMATTPPPKPIEEIEVEEKPAEEKEAKKK